ncbi:hypothetical protein [Arthrobacter sp. SO3]|uniref:hypothetical protein n=1 Tax=Arthrobacter sp. SO3 TaxID=1897057 RepID=UPI001D00139E|nr:hypothetical protein [Arthrobacter sp. SO3]
MTAATCRIERLLLPDALDSPDAGDFLEVGELCDALTLQTWGNLDRSTPPAARLQFWRDNAYRKILLFFVRQDGRMAARSWVRFGLQENLGSATVHVDVLEKFSRRGNRPGAAAPRGGAGGRGGPHHPAELHGAPRRLRPGRPRRKRQAGHRVGGTSR